MKLGWHPPKSANNNNNAHNLMSALDVGRDLGPKHASGKYADGNNNTRPSQQKCMPLITILSRLVEVINLSPQVGNIGQLKLKISPQP